MNLQGTQTNIQSMTVILIYESWYLTVVLTCISLMINDIVHLSTCSFGICLSSLVIKDLFKSSAHFFFSNYWVWEFFMYSGYKSFIRCMIWKYYLLSFCLLFFHFHDSVLWDTKVLILMKSNFSLVACTFRVIFKNTWPNPRCWRFTPVFPSKSFLILILKFGSLIHFVLVFMYGVK